MKNNMTENTILRKITAEYLKQKLGWESGDAYNLKTFRLDGTLGWASDRYLLLPHQISGGTQYDHYSNSKAFLIEIQALHNVRRGI